MPTYFENDEKITKKSTKLIKLQLPYFTKKKKNTVGNMKMISEVYCKFIEQKEVVSKENYLLNKFDKYEKNNLRNLPLEKIDNTEILRKVHIDFNNKHYIKAENRGECIKF